VKVVPPLTITPAMLISTTATEPDTAQGEAGWSSSTAYAVGAKVVRTTTHRVYACIQAHTNRDPATDAQRLYWVDVGPANRWAMFDLLRNTGTIAASPLTVRIAPGVRIDAIALVGLTADTVSISVSVNGSVVYAYDDALRTRQTINWYDYFFGVYDQKETTAVFDVPPYVNGEITITLTRATGSVVCGGVVIGQAVDLGRTIHGAENDALNFSKIERDDFGTAVLQQRRTVPKTSQQTRIKKAAVNRALKARIDLNAQPALWSGLDDAASGYFDPLLILGVYKRFTITMDQPDDALISLELEEV
jgi:hypothetical protein